MASPFRMLVDALRLAGQERTRLELPVWRSFGERAASRATVSVT